MDINESYFDTTKSKKQHIYYCSTFQSQYGLPTMSIHIYVKVDLYSGCDSDATDLRCHFQERYYVIADHH